MDYHPIKKTTQELIKISVIAIPAFLIFLSFIDLFVYYSFFEISIFSFISVNTIISYSLQSIGIVTLISLLSYLVFILLHIVSYIHNNFLKWFANKYPEDSTSKLTIVLVILAEFAVLSCSAYGIYFFSRKPISDFLFQQNIPEEFFLLSLLIGFIVPFLFLIYEGNTKPPGPESNYSPIPYLYDLRVIVSIIIVSTIILTTTKAYFDATNFINNTQYQYIIGDDLKGNYPNEKFKVIGTTGNYYFLKYPESKGVLVKQFNDFKEVHFRTFRDTTKTTY